MPEIKTCEEYVLDVLKTKERELDKANELIESLQKDKSNLEQKLNLLMNHIELQKTEFYISIVPSYCWYDDADYEDFIETFKDWIIDDYGVPNKDTATSEE